MSPRSTTPTTPDATTSGTFDLGGDLTVHRLGFGAMRITGEGVWGPPQDRGEALRTLRRVPELGIDLIDTADSYGPFVSEELIAEALYPYPEGLVIATKAGFDRPGPGEWEENGRPAHLRERCEGSLRRLRVERIDLFQLHRIDPDVAAEDQVGTLKDLQDEGKIRHIGLSEVSVEQIERAREIVDVVSVQNHYHVGRRHHEAELDYCEREGIAFIPFRPLGGGPLISDDGPLARAARGLDATPGQIALAWLLQRSPVMLPIPGTSKVAHLEENTAAAAVEQPGEVVEALDTLDPPE